MAIASKPAKKSASNGWRHGPSRLYPSKRRSGGNAAKNNTATATTATDKPGQEYVGRFAPTPSGDLHLGSLYTAVASYLDARAHRGRWLVRIEDLDRPREIAGSTERILRTLEQFGFEWDGAIVRQSERSELYEDALRILRAADLLFGCSCSRAQLDDELRYPGTCRNRSLDSGPQTSIRLAVESRLVTFRDRIQGTYRQDIAGAVGDFVLKRRDQLYAYVLAVVVDDAQQGITHIVRGADLLDNTPRQVLLQQLLGLAQPIYAHVPVLMEKDGSKLAKSRRSVRINPEHALPQLLKVFSMLGLAPPPALSASPISTAWTWGIAQWSSDGVPKCLNLRVND